MLDALSKIAAISCPKDSLGEQAKGKELEYRIIAVNKDAKLYGDS